MSEYTEYKSKPFEEIWKNIERHFNWEKVHKAMTAMNWVWSDSEGVPSIRELKETAKDLLEKLHASEHSSRAAGGFTASQDEHGIGIEFTVDGYTYGEYE